MKHEKRKEKKKQCEKKLEKRYEHSVSGQPGPPTMKAVKVKGREVLGVVQVEPLKGKAADEARDAKSTAFLQTVYPPKLS